MKLDTNDCYWIYFSNNTSPSAYNGGLTSHVILDLPATTVQQLINYKDKS